MTIIRNLFLVLCALAVSACSPSIPITGASNTVSIETSTPVSTPTELPTSTLQPSATPIPAPTVAPFVPFKALTTANFVNVRTSPGLLFSVSMNVPKDTVFTVMGRAPGGQWIFVLTPAGTKGWVFAKLLKGDQSLSSAPVIPPDQVQMITGRVTDGKGSSISGINFTVIQGTVRNEVMTDADGAFYVYLPSAASGEWAVSYTGIDCSSSLMDTKCNCKADICGAVSPPNVNIQVPSSKPIDFIWK